MTISYSRAKFFEENPTAYAWAALAKATDQQKQITPGAIKIKKNQFKGKRAIILGAGVAGLTTAYELLAQQSGMTVTVLEAQNRTGGRCLSLRTGDTLTEDVGSKLFDSKPGATQMVRFQHPDGDHEPYLNAGPGRIPSGHKRLLSYLKKFGVDIEVYVMNSESNLVQMEGGPFGNKPVVYRRLDHNTRGWLAQMVYDNAEQLIAATEFRIRPSSMDERVCQLKQLMIAFGQLVPMGENIGKYAPTAGEDGLENARARAGFEVLPGVDAGKIAAPLSLDMLLDSEFWDKTRFFQPSDFLWQSTLFQPVGGMDRVQHAFAQQVAALGGSIHLNSPVRSIDWDMKRKEFVVRVSQIGTDNCLEYRANYCFSSIAMPFLSKILSRKLQRHKRSPGSLQSDFTGSLRAVYAAQFKPRKDPEESFDTSCKKSARKKPRKTDYVTRFLANTTKVGWQADRVLWQGSPVTTCSNKKCDAGVLDVPKSEKGVVPIFGGISWTNHEIAQIWYPSNDYHDEKGVLTGAYNFSETAYNWGKLPVSKRLDRARKGAKLFDEKFGEGLHDGVAIAWQNMPYIKGGWAQWHKVNDAVDHFNVLDQGSCVYHDGGRLMRPVFFIIGDQVSSLPGWQEGAIASALNAISRLAQPKLKIAHLSMLPDTRLMVEGI